MSKNLEAYTFKDQKGQTLIKLPGSINGEVFNMEKLVDCKVYILDVSETIYVDNCVNCEFYIAPVKSSFFMRESQNSICSVACKQLRVKNCGDFTFFLYCQSDPHIESSFDMKFAPYNFSYPGQDLDFKKASFDPNLNRWCKVYDHSSSTGTHFSLLPANKFKNVEKVVQGMGKPLNPVPIPQQYGGSLKTEIIPGASPMPQSQSFGMVSAPDLKKNEDNSPSTTQKDIHQDTREICIYFTPGLGYAIPSNQVPAPFTYSELSNKLDLFNEITLKFYNQWVEYLFAIYLSIIGFLLIILLMSLLKMSSDWMVEAVGLFLVVAIGSLLVILIVTILLMKRYEKGWRDQIIDIANQQNSEYFEGKKAKITADLMVLKISLD